MKWLMSGRIKRGKVLRFKSGIVPLRFDGDLIQLRYEIIRRIDLSGV